MSEADWTVATWEANRRLQQDAFSRLSFREKIMELERMAEVAKALGSGRRPRRGRGSPPPDVDPAEST